MDQKVGNWMTAFGTAAMAALMIYGCVMDFVDGDTLRSFAEMGVVSVALGCALASLN